MSLARPEFLLLLLLIPLQVWYITKKQKPATLLFSDVKSFHNLKDFSARLGLGVLLTLRIISLILIILALARPQQGRTIQEVLSEGVDIIITLDLSASTKAEDFKPFNRLFVAKHVTSDFIQNRPNDKIGLVGFGERSFALAPLTLSHNVLIDFLNKLETGMAGDGTAIGVAIATSVERLKESKSKSKIIILITDGENNQGSIDPITAAKIAEALGIKIYTIGVGTPEGAPIPIEETMFGKVYARNPDGTLMLTHLDEKTLKEIAAITGGRYFRATNKEELAQIYQIINKLEKSNFKVKTQAIYRELFPYFLVPALIIIFLEVILACTKLWHLP